MSEVNQTSFKLLEINPSPFLYPAYAICASFRNAGGYLKSESFILIQTSETQSSVFGTKCSYTNNAEPDCPVTLDEVFAIEEAIRQAETEYSVRGSEIDARFFEKRGGHRIAANEIPQHRLVAIWAHTPHSQNLLRIANLTECAALEQFIYSLRSIPQVKHTPIAF